MLPLSPIWRELPNDLTQLILAHLVAAQFDSDPADTWTRLRHVSAHQKRVIEHRFARVWLPRLSITLYGGVRHKVEYQLDVDAGGSKPADDDDGYATFAINQHLHQPRAGITQASRPGRLTGKYIRSVWNQYDPTKNRIITVRLGEGVLSGGVTGGYLLNDTGLPGLVVLPGEKIRFCWKGAVDELLREEIYMRRVGEQMFTTACAAYQDSTSSPPDPSFFLLTHDSSAPPLPPLKAQLQIWRDGLQSARRVAALRHRLSKADPPPGVCGSVSNPPRSTAERLMMPLSAGIATASSASIAAPSSAGIPTSSSAGQTTPASIPLPLLPQAPQYNLGGTLRRGAFCAAAVQAPNIFEVVEVEESAVPLLEVFGKWLGRDPREDGNGGNKGDGGGKGKADGKGKEKAGGDDDQGEEGLVGDDVIVELYRTEWAMRCRAPFGGEEGDGEGDGEADAEGEGEGEARQRGAKVGREVIMLGKERIRWQMPPF